MSTVVETTMEAFDEHITDQLYGSDELEEVWEVLKQHSKPANSGTGLCIDYPGFLKVRRQCAAMLGPAIHHMLCPSAFLRLQHDAEFTVSVPLLFQYLIHRAYLLNMRRQLSLFDADSDGFLSTAEVTEYIKDTAAATVQIAQFSSIMSLEEYSRLAVRKVLFCHHVGGRVPIRELLCSKAMRDFHALAELDYEHMTTLPDNWFAVHSLTSLRKGFEDLDTDKDGILSLEEFSLVGNNTMSHLFLSRVHQRFSRQLPGSKGLGMDLVAFVDFMLAWNHRDTPRGMAVLFPVFDLHHRGYLTQTDLYSFLKEIHSLWMGFEQPELKLEDIVPDIIDLIRPKNPERIRAADILRCGMAAQLVAMLADVNAFWEHENRDNLQQQQQQQGAPGRGVDEDGDEIEIF